MKKIFLYLSITVIISISLYIIYRGVLYNGGELDDKYKSLQSKIEANSENIKKQLENAEAEIASLQHENDKLKQEAFNNKIYNQEDIFSWIKVDQWDEISISEERNHKTHSIKDPNLLKMQLYFLGTIRSSYEPQAKPVLFIYSFKKGNEAYLLNVYSGNVFEYNHEFYECTGNLRALGDAFLPYEKEWLKPDHILNTIYYSNVISGKKTIMAPIVENSDTHRLSAGVAYYLSELQESKKPQKSDLSELSEIISFFNHGEMIQMYIYNDYLRLLYDEKEYWFHGNGKHPAKDIAAIVSAG